MLSSSKPSILALAKFWYWKHCGIVGKYGGGKNGQSGLPSNDRDIGAADIVVDVVVEVGGLQAQAVICLENAVPAVVDAEFDGLRGLGDKVRVGQEGEDDAVRVQPADQRFRQRRRAVAFRVGAVNLQTLERHVLERRHADGDARRQPVAGCLADVAFEFVAVVAKRPDDLQPLPDEFLLDVGAGDASLARRRVDVAAAGRAGL